MVTNTSVEAYESILGELGERQQQVLNMLKTLGIANNKLIAHSLSLGINQVTARMVELREMKYVTYDHEAPCRFTQRNTKWWKCTKYGEELGELIANPKEDMLIVRPFIVEHELDFSRYRSQMKSLDSKEFYDVEFIRKVDLNTSEYYLKKICNCGDFQFKGQGDCKHCRRLESDLKRWNEI